LIAEFPFDVLQSGRAMDVDIVSTEGRKSNHLQYSSNVLEF